MSIIYHPNQYQQQFVIDCIKNALRIDGRQFNQFRKYQVVQQPNTYSMNTTSVSVDHINIMSSVRISIQDKPNIKVHIDALETRRKNQQLEKSDKEIINYIESLITTYFINSMDLSEFEIEKNAKSYCIDIDIFIQQFADLSLLESICYLVTLQLENVELPIVRCHYNQISNLYELQLTEEFKKIKQTIPKMQIIGMVDQHVILDLNFLEFYSVQQKILVVKKKEELLHVLNIDSMKDGITTAQLMHIIQVVY